MVDVKSELNVDDSGRKIRTSRVGIRAGGGRATRGFAIPGWVRFSKLAVFDAGLYIRVRGLDESA